MRTTPDSQSTINKVLSPGEQHSATTQIFSALTTEETTVESTTPDIMRNWLVGWLAGLSGEVNSTG